jgi:hypothetical protein
MHILIYNYGMILPVVCRCSVGFLKSLDAIVDAAIEEKVDLVLFAGDA